MKFLTMQDLDVEDSLDLSWEGVFDGQLDIERALTPFLDALEEYAGEWMPDFIKGQRRRKYSRAAFWQSWAERSDESGATIIGLNHATPPYAALTLDSYGPSSSRTLSVSLHVQPLTFFNEEEHCRRFVELVRAWSSHYPVRYAKAHSGADEHLADAPNYGRDDQTLHRDGFDQIYEVCWLNVFGSALVEKAGRERMLSTPAHRVEELPNGSVLLVTWPTAADFTRPEAREAQARAHVHLRPELDYDTVLRSLHERSAALIPVEPRFPPEVAPFFSRLVAHTSVAMRQRRVAELNIHPPPEPEEWLPAHAALPSDVPDMKATLEHYSLLAESMVAMRHTEVPSLFKLSPESLTDLDFHLWWEDFPRIFERQLIDQRAVPSVGAYLGEVLVRHLGGQWIPRKKLEEAQVRVGSRVWLPFVRAFKYLRSRQALLDFSLTQLYRVAERHRS
ncbi:hypothetical protein [Hyalangium versicolor]|uniref:hypothetical protein n=1 Tax=Hyalangium versicolor TaxID=2861190 RepID=UPI001CCA968A|nr:hypothetical protein [Hyalangium versicolor]